MPYKYTFPETTQYELENNYPNLWETIRKEFPESTIEMRVKIGSLVIGTCGHCKDAESGCQCWNDD